MGSAGISTAGIAIAGATHPHSSVVETWDGSSWTETTNINTTRIYGGSTDPSSASTLYFGGGYPTQLAITEDWDGVAWTEVADLPAIVASAYSAGTRSLALSAGGKVAGSIESNTTNEWTMAQNVKTITD